MNSYRRFRKGDHLLSGAAAHRSRARRNKASRDRRSRWAKMANAKGQREIMQCCTWGCFLTAPDVLQRGNNFVMEKDNHFSSRELHVQHGRKKTTTTTNIQATLLVCIRTEQEPTVSFDLQTRGVTLTCWFLSPLNGKMHRHGHGRATQWPLPLHLRES